MNHASRDPIAYFAALRDEQDEGRITAVQAATERAGLLERHLERCRQLRAEHLGES